MTLTLCMASVQTLEFVECYTRSRRYYYTVTYIESSVDHTRVDIMNGKQKKTYDQMHIQCQNLK